MRERTPQQKWFDRAALEEMGVTFVRIIREGCPNCGRPMRQKDDKLLSDIWPVTGYPICTCPDMFARSPVELMRSHGLEGTDAKRQAIRSD